MKDSAIREQGTVLSHVPANWLASYRLERSSDADWRDANLLRLCERGATLSLHGLTMRSEVLDGPLELHLVTLLGTSDGIHLCGEIRRVTSPSPNGRVLVEIEFIDVSVKAAQMLQLLMTLG